MARFRFALLVSGLLCTTYAFGAESPAKYPLRCQSDDGFLRSTQNNT